MKDWANGDLTSKQVQKYAMHALEQGAEGLTDFAKMGNWGNNPQNLFRAMRSVLGVPKGAPEMDWYEIPTTTNKRTPHPFLLPHRFFLHSTLVEASTIGQNMSLAEHMLASSFGRQSNIQLL